MNSWITERVKVLFDEMFPPGSDGPPEGFRIGDLYERATAEHYRRVYADLARDMYKEAYRIVRELARVGDIERIGLALLESAIPDHIGEAAWKSFVDAGRGDAYAFGAWRAKHAPDWLPF